jgi:hypothetical protein
MAFSLEPSVLMVWTRGKALKENDKAREKEKKMGEKEEKGGREKYPVTILSI